MTLDGTSVVFVDQAELAADFKRWLSTKTRIAIDTETTGLEYDARVRICQVSDGQKAWVIPVELPGSWSGVLMETLPRFNGEMIFHNAPFDMNVLQQTLGLTFPPHLVHDVFLQARVVEPTRLAGLKHVASRHVDPRAALMQEALHDAMDRGHHTWATVPLTFEPYWFYAGLDTILTHRCFEALDPLVQQSAPAAYELERSVLHTCLRMRQHGALIDDLTAHNSLNYLSTYGEDVKRWCKEHFGVTPSVNNQVIEALERDGWTFTQVTDKGNKVLDKHVLMAIDHPLADAVRSYRQATKVASTYLRHFVEDVDSDGRLHPQINQCKARTTRMSMENPNLQNLPRHSGENLAADLVRPCIIPAEGHTLVMCDFDQIEFRLFASLAPGDQLVQLFFQPDVFSAMAQQMYREPGITKADPRRQVMKNSVYTRIYGGGLERFAATARISVDDANTFTAMLDSQYPEIRMLQEQIVAWGRARYISEGEAYAYSPLTHRRFIMADDRVYALVNYLIQGTACEVMKIKLLELVNAGLGDFLVLPVHDEVILEVPNELVRDVAHTLHAVMNDSSMFRVPITASTSQGKTWGAKEELHA